MAHDRSLVPRHATPPAGVELDLRVKVGESSRHLGTPPSEQHHRSKLSPRDRYSPSRSRSGSREGSRDARDVRRDQVPPPPSGGSLPLPLPSSSHSRSPSLPRLHATDSLFRPY